MIRYHYRVGRKLGRTIYRQVGGSPSDKDTFLGIMDDPKVAAQVVKLLNMEEAFQHADPDRTVGERLRAGETVSHHDMRRADL